MEFETDASVWQLGDALVAADRGLGPLGKLPHLTAAIIRQAKIKKTHYLGADVEKALTNLSEIFTVQDIYTKMHELGFEMADSFEAHGKTYKNKRFVTYENFYQNHEDAEVREIFPFFQRTP